MNRNKLRAMLTLFFVLTMLSCASAELPRPESVAYADATVTLGAEGSFSGVITEHDGMIVRMLTFSEHGGQEIERLEETLVIGDDVYSAREEDINGNRYAVFEIKELLKYAKTPSFKASVKARVKRHSGLANGDFNKSADMAGGFTEATANIESDDAELIGFAEREFNGTGLEEIRQVAEWVNTNIEYDRKYYKGTWSAKETFEQRAGVCDEFANLTAAFLRINGVPARYISGVSYDGERFGNHGWIEAFVPERGWVAVDSTYGEAGYVDALHFIVSRARDADEVKSVMITTTSVNQIEIETTLLEPNVEVHSARQFSGIVNAEMHGVVLESEQEFWLTVMLENLTKKEIIVPVELNLHPDFAVIGQRRVLVLLAEGAEESVSFKAKAPKFEKEGMYGKYEYALMLPDGNISGVLEVYPKGKSGLGGIVKQEDDALGGLLTADNIALFAAVFVGAIVILTVLKLLLGRKG
ncbi:transglutaminase-like domain-containing protein [Candidatus Micrarchaeota archaeon]|nr:transglutaminase-like domain-containing protein [Candidatus Micrarchaeota archaeon]